jgi:hypothetical protein
MALIMPTGIMEEPTKEQAASHPRLILPDLLRDPLLRPPTLYEQQRIGLIPFSGNGRRFSQARRALAEARTIHEAKKIRDIAKASADLIKQQKLSEAAWLDAMELKLWAEARVGEFLKEHVNHQGERPKLGAKHRVIPEGISEWQSKTWQKLAEVADEIPAHMEQAQNGRCNPAAAPLIKLAKKRRAPVIWDTTPSPYTRE